MPAASTSLCLFDLDLTLLPIDSDHAWGDFMIGLGWVDAVAFRRGNDAFYASYLEGKLDIDGYVAFSTAPLLQRPAEAIAAAQLRFMREVIGPAMRPAARQLVDGHRQRGDRIALVTATNELVTAPIAEAFGIDTLIATRLQRDASGRPTGRIAGTPAYREGKVLRVGQWLASCGCDWGDFERVTVYSDSLNDLPLLEQATDPVATNPSAGLEALARERGWRILKLFQQ
ncbi:MAG: HAD-IB family hydrolase [Pseudomonadota bacterium]|nr:HAD-IB family hydrolase [Pseudomonadota bacterium]